MRNLEQIRAKNALAAAPTIGRGVGGGRAVAKKVPAMIIDNGFVGAMAFAVEDADKNGYQSVFKAILIHLKDAGMMYGITKDENNLSGFLRELCEKDAVILRAITAEALAYLNYLRRFAKPDKDGE